MEVDYYQKYLKYKAKYLELKEQLGDCNPPSPPANDYTCEETNRNKVTGCCNKWTKKSTSTPKKNK
jgi:hypothetical protein